MRISQRIMMDDRYCELLHKISCGTNDVMSSIKARPDFLCDQDAVQTLASSVVLGNNILKKISSMGESCGMNPGSETLYKSSGVNAEDKSVRSETTDEIHGKQTADVNPVANTAHANPDFLRQFDSLLCDYCELLINYSYAIEVRVVNQEFCKPSQEYIPVILGYLDEAAQILHSCEAADRGKQLLECVYWRKGSLYYMFCHTAYNDKARLLADETSTKRFLDYASTGVNLLSVQLFSLRQNEMEEEYDAKDQQVLYLIRNGVFSDVHMLGLMYAAEMCFWINSITDIEFSSDTFIPKVTGYALCTRYLSLAEGVLKQSRWNTDTAIKIKSFYESFQKAS